MRLQIFPKAAINAAAKCAGEKGARWALDCAQIKGDRLVSMDGHRLFRFTANKAMPTHPEVEAERALASAPNGSDTALVDAKALKDACPKDGWLAVRTDGKTVTTANVRKEAEGAMVSALKADDGLFPEADEIVPKREPTLRIGVNPRLLGEMLLALAPLASEYEHSVTMEFVDADKAFKITATSALGDAVVVMMPVLLG